MQKEIFFAFAVELRLFSVYCSVDFSLKCTCGGSIKDRAGDGETAGIRMRDSHQLTGLSPHG